MNKFSKLSGTAHTLGMLGTLTLCIALTPVSGKGHRTTGILFSILTSLHIYKHRRALKIHFKKGESQIKNLLEEMGAAIKRKALKHLSDFEVIHYLPGRVRLYSRLIHHSPSRAQILINELTKQKEVTKVSVNPQTGSVLVEYSPEAVGRNEFLRDVEEAVIRKYKGR